MKTENINKNSAIFSTCHALTKALVEIGNENLNPNFGISENARFVSIDYRATFGACVKLYFRDFPAFLSACKNAGVSTIALAHAENDKFDIFRAFQENDERKINSMISIAYFYGRKRMDAYRTTKETADDTISDNFAPKGVDNMAQDADDVKNDIVIYLLERADDESFLAKPNLFKLLLAGDDCVKKHVFKQNRRAVREVFSLDGIGDGDETANDKSAFLVDMSEHYADIDKIDVIEYIVSCLPKVHRDVARRFMARYYSNHGKSGVKISDIADALGVSKRTLDSIRAEIKAIGIETVRNRDKYSD